MCCFFEAGTVTDKLKIKKHTHHHPRRCRLHHRQNPSLVFSKWKTNHQTCNDGLNGIIVG